MQNINEIEDLIKLISKLPGLGPKSAKRIVLKLINNRDELVKPMANSLVQVYKNVTRCKSCGSLKSNLNLSNKADMKAFVESVSKQINNFTVVKQSKSVRNARPVLKYSKKSRGMCAMAINKPFTCSIKSKIKLQVVTACVILL